MSTDVDGGGGIDAGGIDAYDARSRAIVAPRPIDDAVLALVPGVLGKISLERAGDCRDAEDAASSTTRRLARPVRPSFHDALRRKGGRERDQDVTPLAMIAEIKRASPSQGAIADLDPVAAARAYVAGGAAALSVLTEPRHFGGRLTHLSDVASDQSLPLLRKDFTVHPRQITEAVEAGASAVLLIVAVLGEQTKTYLDYAHALGLDALVEVHDDAELDIAVGAGATIIGVNNRDLRTLAIDLAVAPRLGRRARAEGFDGILVGESGYRTRAELRSVEDVVDAVLVGTSLAGSGDLTGALEALRGAD